MIETLPPGVPTRTAAEPSPTFLEGPRRSLLRVWPHLAPGLGDEAAPLLATLQARRYTSQNVGRYGELLGVVLPDTALPEEVRGVLLELAPWGGSVTPTEAGLLEDALLRRHYTAQVLGRLLGLWKEVQRLAEVRRAREDRALLRAATALRERLLGRWRPLSPAARVTALAVVTPLELARALPATCRAFDEAGGRLTLEVLDAVAGWVEERSGPGVVGVVSEARRPGQ